MDEPRHEIVDIFFRLVRSLREAQGLTLESLADRAGIHRTHLGLLERGERQPTLSVAVKISEALDLKTSEILLKSELIGSGKVNERDAFLTMAVRAEQANCIRKQDALEYFTGLSGSMLLQAIQNTYNTLDTIDSELTASGLPPIGGLVELANLSSMVGNIVGSSIAEASNGLYLRNRPHQYPDLLPQHHTARSLELKMALETNRPKGHLPKPGTYITFRYVLADQHGRYVRGKPNRGSTVWIWEVKVGEVREEDFDLSNTAGDSGKTATIKTAVFNQMPLVYFDPRYCPHPMRNDTYPAFN
jgi:transcriptional regulator with XRE-family HTH domain